MILWDISSILALLLCDYSSHVDILGVGSRHLFFFRYDLMMLLMPLAPFLSS